jgi:anaerobic magnesium-protoporphyrin IX monomethyl ester cyclase
METKSMTGTFTNHTEGAFHFTLVRPPTLAYMMVHLIKITHKHNVDTRCKLIIGFPEDTRIQIYKSLLFKVKLAFLGLTDCPIFDFTTYSGSELFKKLRAERVKKKLSDEYLESLRLNMQLAKLQSYKFISLTDFLFYRTLGMCMFYGLNYLFRPLKFFKLLKNLVHYETSNSVFEQRIIQNTKNMSPRRNLAAREKTITERVE